MSDVTKVRAVFRCTTIKRILGYEGEEHVICLQAVADKEGTYKSYSKWTPSGQVEMHLTNPGAVGAFELGKTYFLDFSPTPETEQK